MKKSKFKGLTIILSTTLLLFLFIDLFLGKKISTYITISSDENIYRIANENYHHGFKRDFQTNKAHWGNKFYQFCSDKRGFKFNCKNQEEINYDYAFMGDSFTEGIGLKFEETFVGLFKENSRLNVVNLGVASYSPWIYEKKINYLLSNKIIKFEKLVVAIDLTDLEDDWNHSQKEKALLQPQKEKALLQPLEKSVELNIVSKTILKSKIYLKSNLLLSHYLIKQIWWAGLRNFFPNYVDVYIRYDNPAHAWAYKNQSEKKVEIDFMINNMKKLSNLLKTKNIPLIVVIYPHPASILYDSTDSNYKQIWKKFCETECLYFIDGFSELVEKKNEANTIIDELYIKGDVHFNFEGNKYLFEKINNVLK